MAAGVCVCGGDDLGLASGRCRLSRPVFFADLNPSPDRPKQTTIQLHRPLPARRARRGVLLLGRVQPPDLRDGTGL